MSPTRRLYSPLSLGNESELVTALKNQINIDRVVEKVRNDLSSREDFSLMDFFRAFDTRRRGGITI